MRSSPSDPLGRLRDEGKIFGEVFDYMFGDNVETYWNIHITYVRCWQDTALL